MAKNIVICSDGTGNSTIKGRGTNVFKLFEAVDLNGHRYNPQLTPQVALYDDGVGTEDFRPLKLFAGVTGFGLSRNVKQLYKELVRIYDKDDRIFLFGFSRGAFTVRTLADFIAKCGILDVAKLSTADQLEARVQEAYKVYRQCYRTTLEQVFTDKSAEMAKQFKQQHCLDGDVSIAFMGVWDTVDAVGLPFHLGDFINLVVYRFKFPDYHLSASVKRACHALALDDERHSFHPRKEQPGDGERIEQVWFAGAHSNVGGGYTKQGMSLVALDWMIQKAQEAGLQVREAGLQDEGPSLRLIDSDRRFYRQHANVDDKLYDPRAGLGMFYRWKPRDMGAMCRENRVQPAIHLSVLERIAHGTEDYAPGNIAPNAKVVITLTGDREQDAAALARARVVEAAFQSAHKKDLTPPSEKGTIVHEQAPTGEVVPGSPHTAAQSLLSRVRAEVLIGYVSYYVYLLSCIAVLIAASVPEGERSLTPWLLIKNAASFIYRLMTFQLGPVFEQVKRLVTSPGLLALLAGAFLAAYGLALVADRRLSVVFSQFWHAARPKLRAALKRAREASVAEQDRPRFKDAA